MAAMVAPPPMPRDEPPPSAVALLDRAVACDARHILSEVTTRLEFLDDVGLFVVRIESGRADLVILDLDVAGASIDLVTFARSLWPSSCVLALANWWSERAEDVRERVSGVLYKPVRRSQWLEELAKHIVLPPNVRPPNQPPAR